ncbi:lecithin retinol acyltransferase family protein [Aeromonas hydrophila]|nr:hypothetical protein [Aeromonas hydrophila]HAT1534600.1 hypothetical protein [Aeromonas hydrophila]HAT1540612.1 hypothetical protein [Aeromonas hydrophila]HAU4856373.1 hypothetical protein [Aeromonas hydrophila]HAU4860905.1 hypothetical protein [Aeromonas hydrophila]
MSSLHYGDHLISPRIGYEHHGIYVGDDWVIHYQARFLVMTRVRLSCLR